MCIRDSAKPLQNVGHGCRDTFPCHRFDLAVVLVKHLLENGETDTEVVQETLDKAVCGINDLQEEFDEHDSEIETVARECIAATVAYILAWFNIPIDTEEAIRERDW